jgi:holo-[acyl-carrier protein] synthase
MIYGIGTDLVQVTRMQDNIDRYGDKFARRVLTRREFDEYCVQQQPAHFLAKRFAAKEATAKAMGIGFSKGLSLRHIGVRHDELGKPYIEYSGKGRELYQEYGITGCHVSIADERDYAIAFVTLLS